MMRQTLWYIADPMCSWCWGFSPVIERTRLEYAGRLEFELLLGGLRPGTKIPLPAAQRDEILGHWQAVYRTTGQPFRFERAMPQGFVYDTEPASRAVVSVSMMDEGAVFPFFKSVQRAFYAEQQDVTVPDVLAGLVCAAELDVQQFLQIFESEAARNRTLEHFQEARRRGVSGFPAVMMRDEQGYALLTRGYCSYEALRSRLDAWLKAALSDGG
jgi:putative protein-disulfide isomerase